MRTHIALSVLILSCSRLFGIGSCNLQAGAMTPLGKVSAPAVKVEIPNHLRSQLPPKATVLHIDTSGLSPGGEQIVLYNSSRDKANPLPVLAIVQSGKTIKSYTLGDTVKDAGGYALLLAYCEVKDATNRNVIAIALQVSGDGSGIGFLIFAWIDGDYRILFNEHTYEGRLSFLRGPMEFELWDSNNDGECVWCPQHYTVTTYRLQNNTYVMTRSSKPTKAYSPGEVSATPVKTQVGKPTS
jgi:hypothetical protein